MGKGLNIKRLRSTSGNGLIAKKAENSGWRAYLYMDMLEAER
jgi:hypothetical protein